MNTQPKVEIIIVPEEEKSILARLIELYEYDFTEFNSEDVNSLGLFGYTYLDYYWTVKTRYPYFIKVNGKLAGFAMVSDYCFVSKDCDTSFLSEFFVMKKYRKQGIGKNAAKQVFNLHKGKWELTVHPKNIVSVKFWTKVIAECTGNDYVKHENVEGLYDDCLGYAFTFEIK